MSKPIFLTDEYVDAMIEEFRAKVLSTKMSNGKISFTKDFCYEGNDNTKAKVLFTPLAYGKMIALLHHYSSEVAWHGSVSHPDEETFIITDIVVYPQTVTGATVNTDQEEYQKWLLTLDDDFFNSMRMQGHSHVNMGTPSGVDTNHQDQILSQLKGQDFYIFMIFNKRLEHTIKIYDYANNIMYEDKDVEVGIVGDGFDTAQFLAESDKLVKTKVYSYGVASKESYPAYGGYYPAAKSVTEEKKAPKAKTSSKSTSKSTKKKQDDGQLDFSDFPASCFAANAAPIVDYDREIFGDHRIG